MGVEQAKRPQDEHPTLQTLRRIAQMRGAGRAVRIRQGVEPFGQLRPLFGAGRQDRRSALHPGRLSSGRCNGI